jgi:cyclophilin family peptidyl-prolyl cis-trans isomerase
MMFRPFLLVLLGVLWSSPAWGEVKDRDSDAYPTALEQWQGHLQEVRRLRDQSSTAVGEERSSLQQKYADAIVEGEQALAQFSRVAERQVSQGGDAKEEAGEFLQIRIQDLLTRDDFEPVIQIGQLLIAQGFQTADVYEATAIAAYMTNQTQLARDYFQEAEKRGGLDSSSKQLLDSIAYREKAWDEEQRLRQAESEADDLPRVRLSTDKGDIVVELFENEAPLSVANFVHLVDQGFYDGLSFHRVLPHRMAQGGCPQGDGTGGPGYTIPCESYGDTSRRHFRGSLSMAKKSERNTAGSQFFFNFTPAQHLDGEYTVFGRILEGMDVLAKLQRRNPKNPAAAPPDRILKAVVERRRDHEYQPTRNE